MLDTKIVDQEAIPYTRLEPVKRLYALIYQGSRGDFCLVGPFASLRGPLRLGQGMARVER